MKFTSAALSILIAALHDLPDGDADVVAVLTRRVAAIDTDIGTNSGTGIYTNPDTGTDLDGTPTPTPTRDQP